MVKIKQQMLFSALEESGLTGELPSCQGSKAPTDSHPTGLQFLKIWTVWYNLIDSQPTVNLEEVSVKISIKSFQLVQSDITLCYESESESLLVMSYSLRPHGGYSPWNSPGQNTGVGSLSCLQGIFTTQTSNPGVPHCRRILPAEPQGRPRILEWVAYLFSRGSFQPRNWTRVFCIAGGFFTNWAMRGKPHYVIVEFSSVAQSCLTLCNPTVCNMPGFPVHHQLPRPAQTHVHQVSDAIQPCHPLSSPSPPAFNFS